MAHTNMQYDPLCRIDIYSHFFTVSKCRGRIAGVLFRFSRNYTKFDFVRNRGRMERVPGKIFGSVNKANTIFRFHIGQLAAMLKLFEQEWITPDLYTWYTHEPPVPEPIDLESRITFELRDEQKAAVEFILGPDDENSLRSRFIAAPTGTGKGAVYITSVCELKTRTIVGILPKYIDKTAREIIRDTSCKPKELMCIQGGGELKGFIQMLQEGKNDLKFVIISLKTIQLWIKAYDEDPYGTHEDYGIHPYELAGLFKAGQIVIDEAHEHLYAVYQFLSHTHIQKVIGLSATLLSRDPFIEKMQKVMFPVEVRFEEIKMGKYIHAYAISYSFKDYVRANIRTSERGTTTYSQNAFESSILRRHDLIRGYLELIDYLVHEAYIKDYEKGNRLAIFVGLKEMAEVVSKHLQRRHPNLEVCKFVEGSPYRNLMESDIRVTTIQSGGTAHDIPNLTASIMTNNIQSSQPNLQVLGRLRNILGKIVKFYYIYCEQIPKQMDYHHDKMELIQEKVKFIKEFRSPVMV